MDTDDLSISTYKGIIIEAEKFNHDLTLQFGLLASDCLDNNDYLNQAEAIINEWFSYIVSAIWNFLLPWLLIRINLRYYIQLNCECSGFVLGHSQAGRAFLFQSFVCSSQKDLYFNP